MITMLCFDVSSYFDNFFSNDIHCNDISLVINNIPTCVSSNDNDSLLAPFTIKEFKNALFQMNSDKSTGPENLNPAFLKQFSICVALNFQIRHNLA